jgi:hypothetical protein
MTDSPATPEPWTTERIREAFIDDGGRAEYHDPINGAAEQRRIAGAIFDAWLAEHDADREALHLNDLAPPAATLDTDIAALVPCAACMPHFIHLPGTPCAFVTTYRDPWGGTLSTACRCGNAEIETKRVEAAARVIYAEERARYGGPLWDEVATRPLFMRKARLALEAARDAEAE